MRPCGAGAREARQIDAALGGEPARQRRHARAARRAAPDRSCAPACAPRRTDRAGRAACGSGSPALRRSRLRCGWRVRRPPAAGRRRFRLRRRRCSPPRRCRRRSPRRWRRPARPRRPARGSRRACRSVVDGTSIDILSVSISNRLSPGFTASPADLNHLVILPSATVSPSCGISTSIGAFPPAPPSLRHPEVLAPAWAQPAWRRTAVREPRRMAARLWPSSFEARLRRAPQDDGSRPGHLSRKPLT